MKGRNNTLLYTGYAILLTVLFALFVASFGYRTDASFLNTVTYVEHVTAYIGDAPGRDITLPYTFRNLKPNTRVTLKAKIVPKENDTVYIKSVYAPAKIYLDGRFLYAFGVKKEYPKFMLDPATEVHIIELKGKREKAALTMEFLSPTQRNSLTVHPPVLGTSKNVIFDLFRRLGFPVILSFVQMIGGVSLIFIAFCIFFVDKKGFIFFWLGLFAFLSGLWAFAENNFTSLVIKNPTMLFLLSFTALFTFIIPLLHFIRKSVDCKNPSPLFGMEIFFTLSASIALLLQLTGTVSCAKSMYFFHIALPLALLAITVILLVEYIRYRTLQARRFLLPMGMLALCAIVELFNYRFPFTYIFSSIFQMGILLFLLLMGINAGLSIKDSIDYTNRKKELLFEKSILQMQTEEQRKESLLLAQNEQILTQKRHDLRHHLRVIRDLANKENTALARYIDTLEESIPKAKSRFCENTVINAVISHYHSICEKNGIALSVELIVPKITDEHKNSDLCVIFSNLLENAVEACARINEKEKFIRLCACVHYNTLTVTMDNSFSGSCRRENGKFISSKRNDFGVGIESITSIARKYRGDAEFKSSDTVFFSNVYLEILENRFN